MLDSPDVGSEYVGLRSEPALGADPEIDGEFIVSQPQP